MTRQQGINKALEQMGYGTGKQAIANFTQSERKVFREICEAHGIEIAEETKGRGQTYSCEEYRQTAYKNRAEITEQEAVKSKNQAEIETQNQIIADKKQKPKIWLMRLHLHRQKLKNSFGKEKIIEKSKEEIELEKQMTAAKMVLSERDAVEKDKQTIAQKQYQIRQDKQQLMQAQATLQRQQKALSEEREKLKYVAKSQARYEAEKLLSERGYVRKGNPAQQRLMQAQMQAQAVKERNKNNDFDLER